MVTRAFAVEDGNLSTASLTTTRTKVYKDMLMSLKKMVDV